MKYIFAIITALFLFPVSIGFSQTKEIIAEGDYNMGDGETPAVAENRALLQAKRAAIEQAGTYVESYSKIKNIRLTEDEIKVMASGLMEVVILDKKRTIVGDGFHFWVKIKAKVTLDKMEEMAKKVKDKSVIEDYKNIQEAFAKSLEEIEEFKKRLLQAKDEKEKKQIEIKITSSERLFQADIWFERGYKHSINNEYDKAIVAYTNHIALNPDNSKAYTYRGIAYTKKEQYDKAIADYNKAVDINPNDVLAYNNLGTIYYNKELYPMAIGNYNKAIALKPNDAVAYYNRGLSYLKKYKDDDTAIRDKAIKDFSKAISLNPNYADAYNNRGVAYDWLRDKWRAIYDYKKACDMGHETGCKNFQMASKNR